MFTKYQFTRDWRNPEDFPTVETDEAQVREDLQALHEETRQAIWDLIDALSAEGAAAALGTEDGSDVQTLLNGLTALAHGHGDPAELERLCEAFRGKTVTDTLTDDEASVPTAHAVYEKLQISGMADMLQSVYDPSGKAQDIFAYADGIGESAAPAEHTHSADQIGSGILPPERGGTGASTAAQALEALGAAPASHSHTADDLTEGTLSLSRGGTGADTAEEARSNLGAAAASHTHAAADIASGTLGIAKGGTGRTSNTANAVLTGNGTDALKNVSTASGALYATSSGGAAKFGTLPLAQGGTGAATAAAARTNLQVAPALPHSTYTNNYYRTISGATEWINPPMIAGTEYRTTERFNNKVVYTKLVDCGSVTNNTWISYVDSAVTPIRYIGYVSGVGALPYFGEIDFKSIYRVWAMVSNSEISVHFSTGYSTLRVYVQVWYTKS